MNLLNSIVGEFEAVFKLQLLSSAPGLQLMATNFETVDIAGIDHVRASVRICRRSDGLALGGMAEAPGRRKALLLAAAEAYERLCQETYTAQPNPSEGLLEKEFPYGLGIGLRRRSALLRAWGEYHERRLIAGFVGRAPHSGLDSVEEHIFEVEHVGRVHIALGCFSDGILGTGYGLSRREALNSAMRSSARKRDYKNLPPLFQTVATNPVVWDITLESPARWLQCFMIGHTRQ